MATARQRRGRSAIPPSNGRIGELLAWEAENAEGILRKAFKRASRAAFLWPVEAAEVAARGESLTELAGVGPFMERLILRWLDKPPRPPKPSELRRDFLTLAEARKILRRTGMRFPRGDLQMHSQWSDGGSTIAEMAEAGLALGYEYIAITDHSKGLKIAGGIDEGQLQEQGEEIEALNEQLGSRSEGFRVLRSIELNLNPQGEGDMDAAALAKLDLVVGSFHSRLRVTEDQTDRYLKALRHPHVHILGHPRGRIYNFRLGLTADWSRVFAEAARLDKAVEVDSYPDRQDINVELLKLARDSGARIAIDTDAHSASQLPFIEFGLAAAALVKFPVERIINFMKVGDLVAWASSDFRKERTHYTHPRKQALCSPLFHFT